MSCNDPERVFFVLGTGRCGTSFTSKVLHERCNISMGYQFRNSYWEDLDFKTINDELCDGKIPFPQWLNIAQQIVNLRNCEFLLWGFKDPRATILMPIYMTMTNRRIEIIVCTRQKTDVLQSMLKNTDWDKNLASNIINNREQAIIRMTKGRDFYEINFDVHRTEEELELTFKRHFEL